jgi:1-deoxy-D-xylulose-5-phosphate reductoisomerase
VTGIAVLGSTGSIGTSTLNVLSRHRDRFRLVALVAGSNAGRLAEQVAQWQPGFAAVVNGSGDHTFARGAETLVEAATRDDVDVVVNAVVGAAGLNATLAALRAGKRVALANKETLVMAGELVARAAREGGGELVPIDSEHSAVLQCITGQGKPPRRVVLTASGGPFRTWDRERLAAATVDEALNHPTWSMGAKITVDSATLANKALEVIEAHFLFGLSYDAIDVVVHPQSIVHAFVEFPDGSVLAQVGFPTMEIPILYALTHPDRAGDEGTRRFDPVQAGQLTFEPVREDCFPTFRLGVAAGRAGGNAPAAYNAANEVAVAAFLSRRIPFGRMTDMIEAAMSRHEQGPADALDAVLAADAAARAHAGEAI